MPDCTVHRLAARIGTWFDRIDPGTHRRIKGLRLATAFGLAAMLATMPEIADRHGTVLSALAAGFALWASVSEARTTRYESARDLVLLCLAAGAGAASFTIAAAQLGPDWAELTLVSGSFCVGYFKRFGVLGSVSVRRFASGSSWLTAPALRSPIWQRSRWLLRWRCWPPSCHAC
jgi:hypothetical protein